MFRIFTDVVEESSKLSLEEIVENVINWLATEGVKLLVGLIALLIAFYIAETFNLHSHYKLSPHLYQAKGLS